MARGAGAQTPPRALSGTRRYVCTATVIGSKSHSPWPPVRDSERARTLPEREAQLAKLLANRESFLELERLARSEAEQDFSPDESKHTFRTNVEALFFLSRAAAVKMKPGPVILNTASIQADDPSPELLACASTKAAITNFTLGLAQLLGKEGIRVNAVAPGPVWTPLIPATMSAEKVAQFGANTPLGRPAQPAEFARAYVFLASDVASNITGAVLPVMGGRTML